MTEHYVAILWEVRASSSFLGTHTDATQKTCYEQLPQVTVMAGAVICELLARVQIPVCCDSCFAKAAILLSDGSRDVCACSLRKGKLRSPDKLPSKGKRSWHSKSTNQVLPSMVLLDGHSMSPAQLGPHRCGRTALYVHRHNLQRDRRRERRDDQRGSRPRLQIDHGAAIGTLRDRQSKSGCR
jgi:hypothetical protein